MRSWMLILLVLLAACGSSGADRPNVPPTVADPAPTAAAPAPTTPPATPAASDARIAELRYARTGCFQGVRETLTVASDGALLASDRSDTRRQGAATPSQLDSLNAALRAAGGPRPPAGPAPADACSYAIQATLADGTAVELATHDGAAPDPALRDLIELLETLRRQTS